MKAERSRRSFAIGGIKHLLFCWMLLLALTVLPVAAQTANPSASPLSADGVKAAANWLLTQQGEDGSYPGFDGNPDAGATADAVVALAAAKASGADVDFGKSIEYLTQNALVYAQTGPGQAAKLAMAMVAAGENPRDVATVDPVALISHSMDETTHLYGFGVYDHALIMIALAAADEPIADEAITALEATQIDDGSWAFDGSTETGAGDSNTTALVIQALVADGHADDPMITNALTYLKGMQNESGGFAYQPNETFEPDANSTAVVVQALIATGQDPASDEWLNAAGALISFQNESGAFHYNNSSLDDNFLATIQAVPPLAGLPLPIVANPAGEATPTASPAVTN